MRKMPMYDNAPERCDERLINPAGDCFLLGAGFGSVYYLVKGLLSSPSGGGARLAGAIRAVGTNVPGFASYCGAFGGASGAVEVAVARVRRKEDDLNFIVACTATSALFAVRRGASAVARQTIIGAGIFAGTVAIELWCARFVTNFYIQLREKHGGLPAPSDRLLPPVAVITEVEKGQLEGREFILYGEKL